MQCPDCGNQVLPGEVFCDNCGRDLSDLQPAAAEPAPPPVTPPPPSSPVQTQASAPDQPPSAPEQTPTPPVQPPPAAIPSTGPIPAEQPQAAPLPPPPAPTAAKLALKDGSAQFDLPAGKETLVGRVDPIEGIYPDIDLTPHDADTGVSRRHALVHAQGGQWFIRDLDSTNYTVVNRQRLTPDQDYLIEDGDEIRFSRVVVTFRVG